MATHLRSLLSAALMMACLILSLADTQQVRASSDSAIIAYRTTFVIYFIIV